MALGENKNFVETDVDVGEGLDVFVEVKGFVAVLEVDIADDLPGAEGLDVAIPHGDDVDE